MNLDLSEIRRLIEKSEVIAIAGHVNPDGDAIGACMGLAMALYAKGKKVFVLLEEYSKKYDMVPGKEFLFYGDYDTLKVDIFFALDCGDKKQLGKSIILFDQCETVNIDHHESNTYYGKWNFVEKHASSTSEIIFKLIDGFCPFDLNLATALYTGLIYDTGGFRHSSTSAETLAIASRLLSYPVPFTMIYEKLFILHAYSEAKLMGLAIQKAERIGNGKVIYSWITQEEIRRIQGSSKELDGVSGYLKGIEEVLVSAFFYEKEDNQVKVSFRSENEIDVSKIAEKFGGGGHKKAAGCTISVSVQEGMKMVLQTIEKELSASGKEDI